MINLKPQAWETIPGHFQGNSLPTRGFKLHVRDLSNEVLGTTNETSGQKPFDLGG